jgi:CMP-N,N'-diacetyllegionaminic acid synthase
MIAIVPARCGSKGLPGKNIKNLYGKPMIAYTIEEALKSKYITEVIISTDCPEIEQVAVKYGAISYFLRPQELASDQARAIDNYIYTIDRLKQDFGFSIESFVVLQPTSPLRIVDDIDGAIELFYRNSADSVISYVEESHPIEWHKYLQADGRLESIFEDKLLNRQDIKRSYYPNGAVYVFDYKLIQSSRYYSDNTFAYIMPRSRSVDIDTIDDFKYVEFLIRERYEP